LDNFEEQLPRGSSKYINGEDFDISGHGNDVHDLDGDRCVVSFLGGNLRVPYTSCWWPHPRNKYDSQTSGEGHPDSEGVGRALVQCKNGRGRYFRRINGVEYTVSERGDIFVSTHYANSDIRPNPDGETTNGRFARDSNPNSGGGIRVNIKTTQNLELNWNEQEDGIGVGEVHDPSLSQTNPQQTTPYTKGSRSGLFVRMNSKAAIFETPVSFNVKSGDQIQLDSVGDLNLRVGSRLFTDVGDIMDTTVDSDVNLTSVSGSINTTTKLGDTVFTAEEGNFYVTAKQGVQLVSTEADVALSADLGNVLINAVQGVQIGAGTDVTIAPLNSIIMTAGLTISASAPNFTFLPAGGIGPFSAQFGDPTKIEPLIKGASFVFAESKLWSFVTALAAALAAEGALSAATIAAALALATTGIPTYLITDLPGSLSNSVMVE
jgi:hypothetical protein